MSETYQKARVNLSRYYRPNRGVCTPPFTVVEVERCTGNNRTTAKYLGLLPVNVN
ncbi:MAG: hypothetical protein GTO12_20965 [Proteobacteria bacterium]|nr:hypothetical protein [Pseudomonadota bacterium]